VYPEKEWVPWKFEIQPRLLWNNPRNCRMYFEWLADNLQIFSQNQWYQLKNDDVYKVNIVTYPLSLMISLISILVTASWHIMKIIYAMH
jgi:hypothetical protein